MDAPERILAAETAGPRDAATTWTRFRGSLLGPPLVGIQVGHLASDRHPEELAVLRVSTGAEVGGVREVDVNLAIARALAERLLAAGVEVELLAATVPPGYKADVLLSIHADASPDPARRGYKSAHAEPARNPRDAALKRLVDAAYLGASPLPSDDANVSGAMLDYYAFADDRLRHAADSSTAALILELGYLSHPDDRAWLLDPERPAAALADGLLSYLGALERWHPSFGPGGAPGDDGDDGDVLAWRACERPSIFCP